MRSIQTKFVALILGCVLLSALVIGGAGILSSRKAVDENSAQIMNLMCDKNAAELEGLLARIKQSAETLAVYSLDQIDSVELLKSDRAYMDAYTKKLEAVALNIANNTEGAVAAYVRYNPEWAPPTSGVFWTKTEQNGSFNQVTPTDLSSYSPSDIEHVGWYYIPVKNGKATWIEPYYNRNINVKMISYVIPLYMNNETIGVTGMDINFDAITDNVASMKVYESGDAFLTDQQANIMYHKEEPAGTILGDLDSSLQPIVKALERGSSDNQIFSYQLNAEDKKLAFRNLQNGMRLIITAPDSQINQERNFLMERILIATVLISAVAVIIAIVFSRRLIRPLKELNEAAQKVAAGDLSITLEPKTRDEIGTLADNFQQTVEHLRQHIGYINGLAYRDSLTGVKNKTAYQESVEQLEEAMRLNRPEFGVIVFDINDLKQVNDNYGHDFGDMMIIDACKLISKVFRRSPLYRIGGDEFVVLLENSDYENYGKLLEVFEREIEAHNAVCVPEDRISIARGIALYNSDTDLVFSNVFKRADNAMYQNKYAMKIRKNNDTSVDETKTDGGESGELL